nr:hypothetical protein [Propionivibrio sp.]
MGGKLIENYLVSLNIPPEFFTPVNDVCLRFSTPSFAVMPMKKAPVNENYRSITRQDNVRLSRQVFAVETEAESKKMQQGTNSPFWASVFRLYRPHDATSRSRVINI